MTPLAAARREAGKWLSHYDEGVRAVPAGSVDTPEVRLLRALIAALPERVLPDGRYECHCCGAAIVPGGVVFCAECYHASVTVWKSCPHYTAGERHAVCETCGGFGAVPDEPAGDRAAAPGPCINGMPDCPHEGTHYHRKNEGETWGRVYFDDEVTRAFDRLRSQPDETAEACRLHWGTGAGLAVRMAMPGGEK